MYFRGIKVTQLAIAIAAMLIIFNTPGIADAIAYYDVNQSQSNSFRQIDYYSSIGQSFTATQNKLLAFGFYFIDLSPGGGAETLTMSLFSGEGFGGSSIASQSFSLGDNYNNYYDVMFDTIVNPGSVYSVQVSAPTTRWAVATNMHSYANGTAISGSVDYAGGNAIMLDSVNQTTDLKFRAAHTTVSPPVAPEPVSSVLFIAGGSLLVIKRFRKKRSAHV